MSLYSDKAVEAAAKALGGPRMMVNTVRGRNQQDAQLVLETASDPALGRDASVNFGAVLAVIEQFTVRKYDDIDIVRRELIRAQREGRL